MLSHLVCKIECDLVCKIECDLVCKIECDLVCKIECYLDCKTECYLVCKIECDLVCKIQCDLVCKIECDNVSSLLKLLSANFGLKYFVLRCFILIFNRNYKNYLHYIKNRKKMLPLSHELNPRLWQNHTCWAFYPLCRNVTLNENENWA